MTFAVVAGAALVLSTAIIHLHLWLAGYRHVPRIGPLFIAQAVTGFVLAPILALGRHTVVVLAAMLYMAASAGGLLLSATVGFLGIHDGLDVPWAVTSLTVELVGATVLGGVCVARCHFGHASSATVRATEVRFANRNSHRGHCERAAEDRSPGSSAILPIKKRPWPNRRKRKPSPGPRRHR